MVSGYVACDADLVAAAVARAHREGVSWFPVLERQRLRVQLMSFEVRPRCFLYRLALSDGACRRDVMVKVRHSVPHLRRADRYPGRPELTPHRALPDMEAAHREYVGLRLIDRALEGSDPAELGVLRRLAELPEFAALITDYVDQPTLRHLLVDGWQRRLRHPRASRPEDDAWRRLGIWLRRFHAADPGDSLPGRMTTRDQLLQQLGLSREFLVGVGVPASTVRALAAAAAGAVDEVFDTELPSAVVHGDFTAQNVFVAPDGRVTVFDPLPIWRVCVFEDLARLTMGVRLLGPQVVSGGLLLEQERLDAWESDLLSAYAAGPEAWPQLRAFQALVLLDRWGELVSKRPASGRLRRSARTGRVQVAQRWYGCEARRLTDCLA
ncbi:MAG TPA: phosphotransferase [Nocardioides sp.]|nr:phosphotransferase [Nocardioides sp.]